MNQCVALLDLGAGNFVVTEECMPYDRQGPGLYIFKLLRNLQVFMMVSILNTPARVDCFASVPTVAMIPAVAIP